MGVKDLEKIGELIGEMKIQNQKIKELKEKLRVANYKLETEVLKAGALKEELEEKKKEIEDILAAKILAEKRYRNKVKGLENKMRKKDEIGILIRKGTRDQREEKYLEEIAFLRRQNKNIISLVKDASKKICFDEEIILSLSELENCFVVEKKTEPA